MIEQPPSFTLFPYTTLFRSKSGLPGTAERANAESACFPNSRRETISLHLSPSRNFARSASLGLQLKDRKSTRLNSSHITISYAVFCLKKKNNRKKKNCNNKN